MQTPAKTISAGVVVLPQNSPNILYLQTAYINNEDSHPRAPAKTQQAVSILLRTVVIGTKAELSQSTFTLCKSQPRKQAI